MDARDYISTRARPLPKLAFADLLFVFVVGVVLLAVTVGRGGAARIDAQPPLMTAAKQDARQFNLRIASERVV
jgi:hypothetical protein